MEDPDRNSDFSCVHPVSNCLVLAVVYVASLYIWGEPDNRDHPRIIKKRFFSVLIVTLLSPAFLYFGIEENFYQNATIWELLGVRWAGLAQAIVIPLCLTMILFLGPIILDFPRPHFVSIRKNRQLLWVWCRNTVIAPLSEEWTFRACMLPLLLQCWSPSTAIFICPLFFGVAHFHHAFELCTIGFSFKRALIMSCFQFAYTTLFGVYAAFLFLRTGHFVAPVVAHMFCNHMGFPDINKIWTYKNSVKRACLMSLFVTGLVSWCLLLDPLTNPSWFSNSLFWQKSTTS